MEYLSLQDIPHRQYDPLQSRRVAPSERQVGSMADASHYMRNSPPLQPGETGSKLPSFSEAFSEFCNTREDTPPRTPSRRHGSAHSSPPMRPQFDEAVWQDKKRRRDERNDTLGDIYAHQGRPTYAVEQLPVDTRRMSSAIDPALRYRNAHREATEAPGYAYHRRQSSSYPPPHGHAPAGIHNRHRSSPTPQAHPSYRRPSVHSVIPGPNSYHPPQVSHPPVYEQRHSYYPERSAAPQGYGYDHSQASYYSGAQYPGAAPHPNYDAGYHDNIRFHQHVGSMDPNAFNRKRRGNLPKEATNMMKQWFQDNRESPYPTEEQKIDICARTGLSISQVSNWFINARRRAPGKEAREKEASHHGSVHGSNHDQDA